MRFSPRLKAILGMVKGKTLADIGTDHGYLPITAVSAGIIERAIACDVSPGPLMRAAENIKKQNLENRITTRLGYGLEPLTPGEVDCAVIAGMGGMNIAEILKSPLKIKRLILQPQRDIQLVRETLASLDYMITEEVTVEDRGRSYTVIGADKL